MPPAEEGTMPNRVIIEGRPYEGEEVTIRGGVVRVDGTVVHVFATTGVTVVGDVFGEIRAGTAVSVIGHAHGAVRAGTGLRVRGDPMTAEDAQDEVRRALADVTRERPDAAG